MKYCFICRPSTPDTPPFVCDECGLNIITNHRISTYLGPPHTLFGLTTSVQDTFVLDNLEDARSFTHFRALPDTDRSPSFSHLPSFRMSLGALAGFHSNNTPRCLPSLMLGDTALVPNAMSQATPLYTPAHAHLRDFASSSTLMRHCFTTNQINQVAPPPPSGGPSSSLLSSSWLSFPTTSLARPPLPHRAVPLSFPRRVARARLLLASIFPCIRGEDEEVSGPPHPTP